MDFTRIFDHENDDSKKATGMNTYFLGPQGGREGGGREEGSRRTKNTRRTKR